jgi:hypothetical protein
MDRPVIEQLKTEEADLLRKLEAVRGVLRAYGALTPDGDGKPAAVPHVPTANIPALKSEGGRERVGLDRFSEYGRQIVQAAIDAIKGDGGSAPIRTKLLVEMIEAQGLTIRGEDKGNALSALLARSIDVRSNGRRGWTLCSSFGPDAVQENEPSNGHTADGSEPDDEGVAAP